MLPSASWLLGVSSLALLSAQGVHADWRYKSRPDIHRPTLNITIPAAEGKINDGYLFVAPFSGHEEHGWGPLQPSAYIFTPDGADLVWTGFTQFAGWVVNFQASRYNGQDVLFAFEGIHNANYGHGHGHATILDNTYQTVKEVRAGNHKFMDKHEFTIKDGKTALYQIYQPIPYDLSPVAESPDQQWVVNAIFQELDIETGEVLFEWKSLDHVDIQESKISLNSGQAGIGKSSATAWDYFHINSVDKDGDGHYLISARDVSSVYKINGSDGDVIWQLNGKSGHFALGEGVEFGFQHDARFLGFDEAGREVVSLYDNSAHGTETDKGGEVHINARSSGKIIALDTNSWEAELVGAYYPPDGLLSKSQGSTQVLPDGNVIVGWGSEGAVTEFEKGGDVLFHAYLDSLPEGDGVQNYRAYKFRWHGYPRESPAIAGLLSDGSSTKLYVSWNGDTEAVAWNFFGAKSLGPNAEFELLGQAKKSGFETEFVVDSEDYVQVKASAVASDGRVLAESAAEAVANEVKRYGAGLDGFSFTVQASEL